MPKRNYVFKRDRNKPIPVSARAPDQRPNARRDNGGVGIKINRSERKIRIRRSIKDFVFSAIAFTIVGAVMVYAFASSFIAVFTKMPLILFIGVFGGILWSASMMLRRNASDTSKKTHLDQMY